MSFQSWPDFGSTARKKSITGKTLLTPFFNMIVRIFNTTNPTQSISRVQNKTFWYKKCDGCFCDYLQPAVNFTNILRAAFSCESFARNFFVLRFKVCTFLAHKYWRKSRAYKVGEINTWSQFHQHLEHSFFIQTYRAQLFCTYI